MSLKPDFADEPLHALHGHVWQAKWPGIDQQSQMLTLGYEHEPGDWPWAYRAMQTYRLTASGYSHALSIQNLGETAMPAGLGLHPYFPRENASIETDFSAIWILDSDHLPARRQTLSAPVDWFAGPTIDTGFDGLVKEVALGWPTHKLTMGLDAAFDHVVIYIPSGEAFFCVEPVSHVANAINHGGMRWLVPGETWSAFVNFGLELTGKSPWLNPACPRAWLADKPFRSQTFGYPVLVGNGFDQ